MINTACQSRGGGSVRKKSTGHWQTRNCSYLDTFLRLINLNYTITIIATSITGSNAMVVASVRANRRAPSPPCGSRCLGLIPSQRPECIELLLNLQEGYSSCVQPPATFRHARTFLDKVFQTSGNCSLLSYIAEQQMLQAVHECLV